MMIKREFWKIFLCCCVKFQRIPKQEMVYVFWGFFSLTADPLPPSRLEINKEKTTLTSLQVQWDPSSGKVDMYNLVLFDRDNKKIQEVSVPGRISKTENTFSSLIPGNKYNIVLSAVAGNKTTPELHISGSTGRTSFPAVHLSKTTYCILLFCILKLANMYNASTWIYIYLCKYLVIISRNKI